MLQNCCISFCRRARSLAKHQTKWHKTVFPQSDWVVPYMVSLPPMPMPMLMLMLMLMPQCDGVSGAGNAVLDPWSVYGHSNVWPGVTRGNLPKAMYCAMQCAFALVSMVNFPPNFYCRLLTGEREGVWSSCWLSRGVLHRKEEKKNKDTKFSH